MTDTTTHLTRLRTRLLAAAYANADFWTRRTALLTDQALAALARRDPTAAEDLAARQLAPEFLHDTQILGAAVEAGIDTSHWEERRDKIRAYSREAFELPGQFDPATEAKRIWASLYDHYPTIASALIDFLTDLPPTWREDLFTRSSLSPAPTRPATPELPGPETAPYDDQSWEDCEACAEAQDSCRYHQGVYVGMAYQADLIKTLLADGAATEYVQQRHAELEASAAQSAKADANTTAP
ncbi:hypothetical protein [Streptomyces sp. NPDC002132]|uniref:hypothetical protein n=1 Tax=unclassified Streptomyces TaxID=2593676 RepID=UPI00331C3383